MGVVNNELARNMTFNGRVPMPTSKNAKATLNVEVTLLPGLNDVGDEEMAMLEANERFEMYKEREEMSVVSYKEDGKPGSIDDVNITELNVKDARRFIDSIATIELLDAIEAQEKALGDDARKGVTTGIDDHRKKLKETIAAIQEAKES